MVKSRKLFDSLIYYIQYDGPILRVGSDEFPSVVLETLVHKNGLAIWENQGTFKLISAPILHNILLTCGASQQLKEEYPRTGVPRGLNTISWSQGQPISPVIARNFLLVPHEERKSFADPDAATKAASEDQADDPKSNAG